MTALQLVLTLLGASVLSIVLCRAISLPPILGYLLVGALLGPHALAAFSHEEHTLELAEFGVVLLMFTIGLEFSLPRLIRMKGIVFGLGMMQVVFSMALVLAISHLAGNSWMAGVALGGVLAMSSTAILSKLLAERIELDSPHGKQVMGVLLFQDLAVVPLLVIIPSLTSNIDSIASKLGWDLLKAAAILGVVFFLGQRSIQRWMNLIARRKSSELFMLNVLLVTLALAALTQAVGLSLALGAFIAGMLISETQFRYQVEEDIKPFRDLLLGLFFISIGMMLNYNVILDNLVIVLGILLLLLAGKLAVVFAISKMFKTPTGTALRSGLWLCAGGEFGFVLLSEAARVHLLPAHQIQVILAALVLSLLIAPLIVQYSETLVMRLIPSEWFLRSMQLTQVAARTVNTEKHAIICGYGRTGAHIGRFLSQEGIGWVALDNDADRVQKAANAGIPVVFGDSARREILMAAGLARASVVIISFSGTDAALRVLANIREVEHDVPVVSRAREQEDGIKLFAGGATEVIPEALESSVMLATHALALLGVPMHRVIRRLRELREEHYALLRGFMVGIHPEDGSVTEEELPRLKAISLDANSKFVGHSLAELEIAALGFSVSAVRRRHYPELKITPDLRLEAGDVVVVLGNKENLENAVSLLRGEEVK